MSSVRTFYLNDSRWSASELDLVVGLGGSTFGSSMKSSESDAFF